MGKLEQGKIKNKLHQGMMNVYVIRNSANRFIYTTMMGTYPEILKKAQGIACTYEMDVDVNVQRWDDKTCTYYEMRIALCTPPKIYTYDTTGVK